MSIFDDKKLIKILVTEGAKSISKQAAPPAGVNPGQWVPPNPYQNLPPQGPAQLTPQQTSSYNLAKKMATDLLEQVAPDDPEVAKKPSPIGFEGGRTAEIKPDNLKDLGDFINWAATNGLTWNGKRVAWITDPPTDANVWSFRAYSQDRSQRDKDTRKVNEFTAYADKTALLALLTHLRDSEEAKTTKPYQVQLGKIIGQINEFLEKNEQIGGRAPEKGGAAVALDPNAIVDSFPSSTLDMATKYEGADRQPNFEGIPVPLMVKHISSREGLIGWLTNMKVKTDKGVVPVFTPEVGDPCIAIHILYLRAKYLNGIAVDTPKKPFKKMTDLYLTNIQTFGKTFENAKGPCAVVQPTSGVGAGAGAGAGAGGKDDKSGAGAGGAASADQIQRVIDSLPLSMSNIDFRRIQAFYNAYAPLASPTANQEIAETMNMINTIWNGGGGWGPIVKNKQNTFSLYAGVSEVAGWLTNNQAFMPFIAGLEAILRSVKIVLEDLNYQYGSKIKGDNLTRLKGQVEGSSSIWQGNWGIVETWRARATEILKTTGKS